MHNLSVHRGCNVVFDSDEVPDYSSAAAEGEAQPLAQVTVDLSFLRPLLEAARPAAGAVCACTAESGPSGFPSHSSPSPLPLTSPVMLHAVLCVEWLRDLWPDRACERASVLPLHRPQAPRRITPSLDAIWMLLPGGIQSVAEPLAGAPA